MRFPQQDIGEWHKWFAWWPTYIGNELVWLETIERRGECLVGLMDVHTIWKYRHVEHN